MTKVVRRSETSRLAILRATVGLLGRVGLTGLTIEGIAAEAGTGKQTIYRWWPSRGAVAIDALLLAAEPQITFADTGNLRADLSALLTQVSALLAEPVLGPHFVACLMQSQADPALATKFAEAVFTPIRSAYRARMSRVQGSEIDDDVDLDTALDMAFGAVWLRAATQPERLDPAYGARITDTLLDGIGSASSRRAARRTTASPQRPWVGATTAGPSHAEAGAVLVRAAGRTSALSHCLTTRRQDPWRRPRPLVRSGCGPGAEFGRRASA